MSAQIAPGGDPGKQSRAAAGLPVVPAFDGYRAYAILAIVVLHLIVFSGGLTALDSDLFGHLVTATLGQAIDVLFVISGFVVFLPTVARGGDFGPVRGYAIRRAARLVPAYWAILALALVLIALVPVAPPITLPGAGSVIAHLLFLQTPIQMVHPVASGFGVNGAVWTLSLEITFYLLLPLIATWYARRPLVGLAAAACLTALWHELFSNLASLNSSLGLDLSTEALLRLQTSALSQFPFFAFSFAAGMTGAWVYVRATRPEAAGMVRRIAPWALVVSLVGLALFAYLVGTNPGADLGPEAARRPPLLALGYSGFLAAAMVAGTLAPAGWQRLFANRPARRLGDISYGVYLAHVVIVTFTVRLLGVGGATGDSTPSTNITGIIGDGSVTYLAKLTVIVVPLSLAYGWVSARFLEQPIRRWARRYGRRGERTAA